MFYGHAILNFCNFELDFCKVVNANHCNSGNLFFLLFECRFGDGSLLLYLLKHLFCVDSVEQRSRRSDTSTGFERAKRLDALIRRYIRVELLKNLVRGIGHKGLELNSNYSDTLKEIIKHRTEPCALIFILCEQPRSRLVDIFVAASCCAENSLKRIRNMEIIHAFINRLYAAENGIFEILIDGFRSFGSEYLAAEIFI